MAGMDPELLSMQRINRALDKLNPAQKRRVASWLLDRLHQEDEVKTEVQPATEEQAA